MWWFNMERSGAAENGIRDNYECVHYDDVFYSILLLLLSYGV